ncbi:MAG: glycerol-3-phosphate 1-O-acyltransferase PlsY [Defluviitaleaceae bacterium]|nr:glycerol-3-phosphate 1-O-acyltransferase PlsY [Defluviitaleaceae bacterium]
MFRLACLLIGYLFGCLQTAYFTGKIFKRTDIREHGSGNAGATNVVRTFGVKFGIAVFVIDILKAVAAVVLAAYIFDGTTAFSPAADDNFLPMLYAGLGTILGHNFPVFLKFKGGKGAACTIGVILALNFSVAVLCYLLAVIAISFTKYVSLGSLILLAAFPALMIFFEFFPEEILIAFIICALGWLRHKDNISKILQGTERKLGQRDKV